MWVIVIAAVELTKAEAWSFPWGNGYSATKIYNISSWMWKSKCSAKLKAFACLLFNDSLNTKDILERRNFHTNGGSSCVCVPLGTLETRDHLFWNCSFGRGSWASTNLHLAPPSSPLDNMVSQARGSFNKPLFREALL